MDDRGIRADGGGDRPCARGLYGLEALAPAFLEDADEIDDRVGACDRALDRFRVSQVRLDELDLADGSERLKEGAQIGPSDGDKDPVAALGEGANHLPPHEASATKHGHELRVLPHRVHSAGLLSPPS